MGVGTGVMNMQSAVEVYNAPGVFLGNQAQLDLIRWYGLPSWHYAGHSDSKVPGRAVGARARASRPSWARSRARRCCTTSATSRAGCRARWRASCSATRSPATPEPSSGELPVDDEALALAEVEAVGPGGNHLGTRMTRRHFRDFWRASLIDQNTYDRWSAAGGQHAARAGASARGRDPGGGPVVHAGRRRPAEDRRAGRRRPGLTHAPRGGGARGTARVPRPNGGPRFRTLGTGKTSGAPLTAGGAGRGTGRPGRAAGRWDRGTEGRGRCGVRGDGDGACLPRLRRGSSPQPHTGLGRCRPR